MLFTFTLFFNFRFPLPVSSAFDVVHLTVYHRLLAPFRHIPDSAGGFVLGLVSISKHSDLRATGILASQQLMWQAARGRVIKLLQGSRDVRRRFVYVLHIARCGRKISGGLMEFIFAFKVLIFIIISLCYKFPKTALLMIFVFFKIINLLVDL